MTNKDIAIIGVAGTSFILLAYFDKLFKKKKSDEEEKNSANPYHHEPMTMTEALVMSYQDAVRDYTKVRNIEPALISALIDVMSQGRADLIVRLPDGRDAYGLMGITEKRAKTAMYFIKVEKLLEPNFNIFVGVNVFQTGVKKYGNALDALAFFEAEGPFVSIITTRWENVTFITQVCARALRYRVLWRDYYNDYDTRFHLYDDVTNYMYIVPGLMPPGGF